MILSGTLVAEHIEEEICQKILSLPAGPKPALAVVLVGDNSASHTYVNMKKKACLSVGIQATVNHLPASTTEKELLDYIHRLNQDPLIHGILLQLPLPQHLSSQHIIQHIDPLKDVDGLHPLNMGKLLLGITDGFIPCTPLGIQVLLSRYSIETSGKHMVIVGRSQIVGKPLAALFMQNHRHANATVTIAHRHTHDLPSITRTADILVAAVGIPSFITSPMVKEGAIVIDVGINRVEDPSQPKGYRLTGDVDFPALEKKCQAITPVPKGVGPMTVAMLLHNTLLSFERTQKR